MTKGTRQEAESDKIHAYADFQALVNDSNVDIIYIATPQSEHYRNILMTLEAGKHVCCEVSKDLFCVTYGSEILRRNLASPQQHRVYIYLTLRFSHHQCSADSSRYQSG